MLLVLFTFCFLAFLIGVLSVVYLQHSNIHEFLNGRPSKRKKSLASESVGSKREDASTNAAVDPLRGHPLAPAIPATSPSSLQESPQSKTNVQSKTKTSTTTTFFSPSALESFFKKTSTITGSPKDDEQPNDTQKRFAGTWQVSKAVEVEEKRNFTGSPQLDYLLETIINYILRDFLHSWYRAVSEDKEFVDVRTKHSIEETVANLCLRIKSTPFQPFMTTSLVDHLATHTRLYRLAQQAVKQPSLSSDNPAPPRLSPFRKIAPTDRSQRHRRNKSDTDLSWHMGHANQRSVANSKFYTTEIKEECLFDPEMKLLHAFFDHNDNFRAECLEEKELERYLTRISETILYFTLPDDDFACLPLRTLLATILANVVFKPLLEILSDPDFINLQIARLAGKETPPAEFFIKMVRQCTDLSELRACRQLITKEMEQRAKEPNSSQTLNSLKFTQKLIDNRIASQQTHKLERKKEKFPLRNIPILSLEEILNKDLALSYYLDYLSQLKLQKYVLFYLGAREWKQDFQIDMALQANGKMRVSKEKLLQDYRERAQALCSGYLTPGTQNHLVLDSGLVEVINIKLRDQMMPPDSSLFESISKFIYEKLKSEEIFLHKFYQNHSYRNLLLELEVGQDEEIMTQEMSDGVDSLLSNEGGSSSDNNSGDIPFEVFEGGTMTGSHPLSSKPHDTQAFLSATTPPGHVSGRHNRSHSDCSGIVTLGGYSDSSRIPTELRKSQESLMATSVGPGEPVKVSISQKPQQLQTQATTEARPHVALVEEISARIINTAINPSGQYAVYAIEVVVTAPAKGGQVLRQWHVYRRYSKFLELKKMLEKRYPNLALPFPPKKTFQNTQRAVLEHRMTILNDFLHDICTRMRSNSDIKGIVREFLEADPVNQQVSGGNVTRTLEIIVNPLKSGMTKIKNMPDSLVGGLSRILTGGRETLKPHHGSYLMDNPQAQMDGEEYPALRSMLNLMDEVFDLQTRSQWLRRGIVNRVLGVPGVSSTANKKIIQAAKGMIDEEKMEMLLTNILSTVWPDGRRAEGQQKREDNTKLRTRMAAKVSLFAMLNDDLCHLVGSETTRWGLLNMYSMWQNKTLNLRLSLVVLEEALKLLLGVDSLTKHIDNSVSANNHRTSDRE